MDRPNQADIPRTAVPAERHHREPFGAQSFSVALTYPERQELHQYQSNFNAVPPRTGASESSAKSEIRPQNEAKYMFIQLSGEPGKKPKTRDKVRSEAKAHVMHEYQRKQTLLTRRFKNSTVQSYSGGPSQQRLQAPSRLKWKPAMQVESQPTTGESTTVRSSNDTMYSAMGVYSFDLPVQLQPGERSSQLLLTEQGATEREKTVSMPTLPYIPSGFTNLDVFKIIPIQLDAWTTTLIIRWLHYDRLPFCPINGQSVWIPFILRSPMLLHTNLYAWGMHFHSKLEPTHAKVFLANNPQIWAHKVEAISRMNSHLSSLTAFHAGHYSVSDEILASVAIMINVSLGDHQPDEATRHMSGLETLVRLRGGLATISQIGPVGILMQKLIGWNDLFYVEMFGGSLRFDHLPLWENAWQEEYGNNISEGEVASLEPLEARFSGNLRREMQFMLNEIQVVCKDVEARPTVSLSYEERFNRNKVWLRFERRLCLALRIVTTDGDNDLAWRAVAFSALIYVHHHMRGHFRYFPQFTTLVGQLRNLLIALNTKGGLSPLGFNLSLWVISVGCHISDCEAWWLDRLRAACWEENIFDFHNFIQRVQEGPWLGEEDRQKLQSVWERLVPLGEFRAS